MRSRTRGLIAVLSVLLIAVSGSGHAAARTASQPRAVRVTTARQFEAAVARFRLSGGTIALAAHRYGPLTVGPRGRSPLTIEGRGASTAGLLLQSTRAVRVKNLSVTPGRHAAYLDVNDSVGIRLTDIHARGTDALAGAVSVIDSRNVVITRGSFSHCGRWLGRRTQGYCLRLRDARHVVVRDSAFHDCTQCDFVHGTNASYLTITRTSFRRALGHTCGLHELPCNHQDLIQLNWGDHLRFTRNVFGVFEFGAAQIYLTNMVKGVYIANNLFERTDPRVPGFKVTAAVALGNQHTLNLPRDVVVTENTMLSGAPGRLDGIENSLFLSSAYARLPLSARPLVVNNVLAASKTPSRACGLARYLQNVLISGTACDEGELLGDPLLNPDGTPTSASALIIDQAVSEYATPRDITGADRDAQPDIGAFEYIPPPAAG